MAKPFGSQQPDVWIVRAEDGNVASVLPDRQSALDAADALARTRPGVDIFVYRCSHKGTSRAQQAVPIDKAAF